MNQLFKALVAVAMAVREGSQSGGRTLRTISLVLTFALSFAAVVAMLGWLVTVML